MNQSSEPKRKVEELIGRRDALLGEVARAEAEQRKFREQNLVVEAREAEQDVMRLRQRLELVNTALNQLRRYW